MPPQHEIHRNTDKRGSSAVQKDACSLPGEPTVRGRGFSHQAWQGEASQAAPVLKSPPAYSGDGRDGGSIPRSGRSPGGGDSPLQYSCPESRADRGAWRGHSPRLKPLSTQAGSSGTKSGVCPGLRQCLKRATRWQHLPELHESWHWEPQQKLLKLKTYFFLLCSLCSRNQTASSPNPVTPRQAPLVPCCLHPQRSPHYSHLCWLTPAQESLPPNSWLQSKTGA